MQKSIVIYELKNDANSAPANFYALGELNQFDSAVLRRKYCGCGNFEIWAPITAENRNYFSVKSDSVKFIYFGDKCAGFVETVRSEVSADGSLKYYITGRTCEALLYFRAFGAIKKNSSNKYMLVNTTTFSGLKTSSIITKMLHDCYSADASGAKIRVFPFMAAPQFGTNLPDDRFDFQRSGGTLYDGVIDFLSQSNLNLGFEIQFDPYEKKLIPRVYNGIDRTASQSDYVPVVFSDELNDILTSQYIYDSASLRNTAFVAGEGEGSDRTIIQTTRSAGNANLDYDSDLEETQNFGLRELYIDARDVSRRSQNTETEEGDQGETELTDAEYIEVLAKRGTQKLGDYNLLQTFSVTIRTEGNVMYKYGEDYGLGDIITIEDTRLGISVETRVTASEETFGSQYELKLSFGDEPQTLTEKLNSMNNNMTN